MTEKKSYKLTDLTIGSKVFLVHKNYAFQKKPGGRVVQARVVGFFNTKDEILPEFKVVGYTAYYKSLINESSYVVFMDIKKAIQAIKS